MGKISNFFTWLFRRPKRLIKRAILDDDYVIPLSTMGSNHSIEEKKMANVLSMMDAVYGDYKGLHKELEQYGIVIKLDEAFRERRSDPYSLFKTIEHTKSGILSKCVSIQKRQELVRKKTVEAKLNVCQLETINPTEPFEEYVRTSQRTFLEKANAKTSVENEETLLHGQEATIHLADGNAEVSIRLIENENRDKELELEQAKDFKPRTKAKLINKANRDLEDTPENSAKIIKLTKKGLRNIDLLDDDQSSVS